MARILKARDIERLENTSFASALLGPGPVPLQATAADLLPAVTVDSTCACVTSQVSCESCFSCESCDCPTAHSCGTCSIIDTTGAKVDAQADGLLPPADVAARPALPPGWML